MRHKDSDLYKAVLELASKGGGRCELWSEDINYAPYDENEQPWAEAARDVACHLGAKRIPVNVYFSANMTDVRVWPPEF